MFSLNLLESFFFQSKIEKNGNRNFRKIYNRIMIVTTLTDIHLDINSSDIDKDQICDTYKQTLVYSFNDVFQQSSIKKNSERENHRFTIRQNWLANLSQKRPRRIKESLQRQNVSKNVKEASECVEEPKEKNSTSSNGNENLRSEIVVNEYPQKPKKQTSSSSFF